MLMKKINITQILFDKWTINSNYLKEIILSKQNEDEYLKITDNNCITFLQGKNSKCTSLIMNTF